ncbi:heparin lyase I family protein [Parapedobacter sp. DT-150]|uniref:heparin lyase I family protein n=1 Tax=Parapedobacter sp. DT-150 TaxID=3396162 RepID=UPI003F1C46FA
MSPENYFPPVWDLDDYATVVHLDADGPGNTYELLGSVLGGSPVETPDCGHGDFGRHITEEFNDELNKHVFAFFAHVVFDDDRCGATDRQRTEIKTYSPSPDDVKAFDGDEMIFKWKFKLADGFQPSAAFTHIHQIKAGDGTNNGSPLITITPRYGNPDKLEIIHTGNTRATSLNKARMVNLEAFKGIWVEAVEKVKFGTHGRYALELRKVSDGTVLLSYENNDIDLWRSGATFIRPKWGIYRSLNNRERLRDEKVLFADFVIGKK